MAPRDPVKACPVNSLGTLDGEIGVDQEDVVELGLKISIELSRFWKATVLLTDSGPSVATK
jgi:hypothetical protein